MKKLVLSVCAAALALTATTASAQKSFYKQPYKTRNSGSFNKGANLVSLGVGAPYAWSGYDLALPPVYLKYEYGIMDEVGVGIIGGLGMGKNSVANYTVSTVGALGYYHFNKFIPVSKLDVYAGAGGAMVFTNTKFKNPSSLFPNKADNGFHGIAKLGARYYFTPNIAAYVEAGYDAIGPFNAGVTFKF